MPLKTPTLSDHDLLRMRLKAMIDVRHKLLSCRPLDSPEQLVVSLLKYCLVGAPEVQPDCLSRKPRSGDDIMMAGDHANHHPAHSRFVWLEMKMPRKASFYWKSWAFQNKWCGQEDSNLHPVKD